MVPGGIDCNTTAYILYTLGLSSTVCSSDMLIVCIRNTIAYGSGCDVLVAARNFENREVLMTIHVCQQQGSLEQLDLSGH